MAHSWGRSSQWLSCSGMRDGLGNCVVNWKTSVEPGLMERQPHMKQKRVYLYSSGPVPAGQSIHNSTGRRQAVTVSVPSGCIRWREPVKMTDVVQSRWLSLHSLGMQWEEVGKNLFSMVCMNHIQVRSQSRSVLPLNYGGEDEVIKMFIFFSCNWYVKKDLFYHSKRASQVVLVVKKLTVNVVDIRDLDLIPGSGRFPGGGHGTHSSILA